MDPHDFFSRSAREIEEAALIDGCSRLQALYKIVLPLAAPGILTAALLVFIQAWNEFFFALIIMTDPNVQTLPVGIALFPGEYTMPWGEIAAASTMATLPLIISHVDFSARHCERVVGRRGERLRAKSKTTKISNRRKSYRLFIGPPASETLRWQ